MAVLLACLATTATAAVLAGPAGADAPQWRVAQPPPPEAQAGVTGSQTPVGLGRIGDIEFWAPNLGALITDGNGSTVPPGVWVYNGQSWHELAEVCGATDGRIAWAGPDEFWTVSDGRAGQAANGHGLLPPLEDDTLCRFARKEPANPASPLEVVDSYATLGFQASSYQPMHAAACLSPTDCWFAGGPLPAPQVGAFHLHWNGTTLEAEPNTRIESVQAMRVFQGNLYESIGLPLEEPEAELTEQEILHPSVIQQVVSEATGTTFKRLLPRSSQNLILPEYAPPSQAYQFGSLPQALGFLRLASSESSLWAAAGPTAEVPSGSAPGELTVLHDVGGQWSQVLGPETEASAEEETDQTGKVVPEGIASDAVTSIATEPAGSSAWLALDSEADANSESPKPTLLASVAHVGGDGSVAEEQVPTEAERLDGVGAKGAAYRIACPAANDCWLATTQGWLFHLSESGSQTIAPDTDASFQGPLITHRPGDEGLPQVQSDTLPIDDSGLEGEATTGTAEKLTVTAPQIFATVSVPLLSDVHSKLRGTTLELSFHLAVKARVRLIAKRHTSVVASTPTQTLKSGRHTLSVHLSRARWPTKLNLETHALAPLPKVSTRSNNVESVSTSAVFPSLRSDLGEAWAYLQGTRF